MLAAASSSGTTSGVCAGTEALVIGASDEDETGVGDEQATRKEEVTNALTLRSTGSFIFSTLCRFCALAS